MTRKYYFAQRRNSKGQPTNVFDLHIDGDFYPFSRAAIWSEWVKQDLEDALRKAGMLKE